MSIAGTAKNRLDSPEIVALPCTSAGTIAIPPPLRNKEDSRENSPATRPPNTRFRESEPDVVFDSVMAMRHEAFHGLAGEFTRQSDAYHSADPHAVLLNFLTIAGNRLGAGCRSMLALGALERPILYTLLVRPTSLGRKSTSVKVVRTFWEAAEPGFESGIMAGLSTGEGLIAEIRDGSGGVPGVSDKRRLVTLDEFGLLADCMGRDGNTTSSILKSAVDGQLLQVATKTNPVKATNPHVSIIGCCTPSELIVVFANGRNRRLASDGFANRFLYVHSEPGRRDPTKADRILAGAAVEEMWWRLAPCRQYLVEALSWWAAVRRPVELPLDEAARAEYTQFLHAFSARRADMQPSHAGF